MVKLPAAVTEPAMLSSPLVLMTSVASVPVFTGTGVAPCMSKRAPEVTALPLLRWM